MDNLFGKYGKIEEVRIANMGNGGGFGFVVFDSKQAAQNALNSIPILMDNMDNGYRINIQPVTSGFHNAQRNPNRNYTTKNEKREWNGNMTSTSVQDKPQDDNWFAQKLIDFMVSMNLIQKTDTATFVNKRVSESIHH